MTSLACARLLDVTTHCCTVSGPSSAGDLDKAAFPLAGTHPKWAKRTLGMRRQSIASASSLSNSSFLGVGCNWLLNSSVSKERAGSSGFKVVAMKRGGGVRRKSRDVNPMEMASRGPKMNEAILVYPNIRLLDQDQKMIGIVASADALLAARNKDLDLVLIAGDADPPVCRIMDYTKYKYEKDKKARDSHKKAKAHRVDQKELKMRYNTDVGDYNTTLRKCMRFLRAGDKVKFSMMFKAREMGFQKQGLALFEKVQQDVGEWAVTEGRITIEGRNILLMLAPNKPYIEKIKREEARAGKLVEDESSDDEVEGQEEVADSDDDEEDVDGADRDGDRGVATSNGAAVQSESATASVQ